MILKLLDPKLLENRPSTTDAFTLGVWRSLVLSQLQKSNSISPKVFHKIEEKFLKPQEWKGTAKPVVKGTAIASEDEMNIEGFANAANPDRGRELILNSAWRTENYDLNPIILFNHNHNYPIGSCTEYKVDDQGLYYRATIGKPSAYPTLTDIQIMCRSLLAQGILKASSVGFLPFDLEYDEVNDILRYTDVELLEISLVSVPMQQGSLLDSVGPAAKQIINTIDKGIESMDKAQFDELKAMLQKISDMCSAMQGNDQIQQEACDKVKEENKSLKSKIEGLEKSFADLKTEKEDLEKSANELLDTLQKQGVKIEA